MLSLALRKKVQDPQVRNQNEGDPAPRAGTDIGHVFILPSGFCLLFPTLLSALDLLFVPPTTVLY